ncbi:MAG: response regulator transcription factor [Candidatus Dormibacteria bacterium]
MRVLLAEDDEHLRGTLARGLREEGYVVEGFARGDEAVEAGLVGNFDLAILDWNLPGQSGVEVCRSLRAGGAETAILILTARDAAEDRVAGLNEGADDYLIKPFDFDELLARLRALLRRRSNRRGIALGEGNLVLEPRRRTAMVADTSLELTPREFAIIERLVMATEPIVSRADLARSVMDDDIAGVDSHSLYVHVSRIRKKLNQAGADVSIETVRGLGFRIRRLSGA